MSFQKFKHDCYISFAGFMMKFMGAPSYMLFAGDGSAHALCRHVAQTGMKKVLVVTDKPLIELGLVDNVLTGFAGTGVETVIYDGVLPDPTFEIVAAGHKLYQENNCDSILAIGGGSAMDAAKVIGLAATHPGDPRDYVGFGKAKNSIPPLYTVPTTSGTGSEATRGAVISDTETHQKGIISGATLGPTAACIDASLLTGLPPHITAATGMDALTHAIEAYISVWDTGDAKVKARAAVKLIFEHLPTAYAHGANLEARDAMAHAAYMAGQAINQVNVGNVHAIAHQLGGQYGIPHGLANSMVLPHVLDMSLAGCRTQLTELAQLVGKNSAEEFIAAVREMNATLDIPEQVAQLQAKDIPAIQQRAVDEGAGYSVPHFMEPDDCRAILEKLLPEAV
jgi:alcohol dehydrogenase